MVVAALALAAREARRRLVPGWNGLPARLVEVVLALGLVTLVTEALGTVGLLQTAPVVVACAATGVGAWAALRRWPARGTEALEPLPAPPRPGRAAAVVAWAGMIAVSASWTARAVRSLEGGMQSVDTLWYHLPFATRFMQTGHIMDIH